MDDYIETRVKKQRQWYETKANLNKKTFVAYQTVIIILGAIIPVLVAFETVVPRLKEWGGPLAALISAVIAVIAGLDKLKQPQPNWFNYRANEETIKKEEWFYKCRAGQYKGLSDQEAHHLLVETVESIISADITRMTNLKEKQTGREDDEARESHDTNEGNS